MPPRFTYGSRWDDREGDRVEDLLDPEQPDGPRVEAHRETRTWVVDKHPVLRRKMMRLDGQDPALWHEIDHVVEQFGPLTPSTT